MNIKQALAYGLEKLSPASSTTDNLTHSAPKLVSHESNSPVIDTQVLLCHTLSCNSAKLIAWPERELSDTEHQQFIKLITQRRQGIPVAYVTGHREFWSLDLVVTDATLIPRPETELLVETILNQFAMDKDKKISLVDLGTGSGAIAIAIANERPHWKITATDISSEALDIAAINAKTHQLPNIKFHQGRWLEGLPAQRFDIIVSNPPYIADHDEHLTQGDVRFEPEQALASGPTGMNDIEHICQQVYHHLKPGGLLLFEHGYNQQKDVLECLQKNKFKDIMQLKDLAGHVRASLGRL